MKKNSADTVKERHKKTKIGHQKMLQRQELRKFSSGSDGGVDGRHGTEPQLPR
jgi:hypothetical protein